MLYLQLFARWQLCRCSPQYVAAPSPWLHLYFTKSNSVYIYTVELTRKWLLCIIISIAVLSNTLITLYLHPFARWQLCWCSAVRLDGRHNMTPPRDLDFWPFDLDVGVGVACDLGYPCAKFRLPRPFGFRVRADVRDIRRTDGRTDGRTDRRTDDGRRSPHYAP